MADYQKFSDWSGGIDLAKNPTELEAKDCLEARNQGGQEAGVLTKRDPYAKYNCDLGAEITGIAQANIFGQQHRLIFDKSGAISSLNISDGSVTQLKTGLSTLDNIYWSVATLNDTAAIMTNGIDRPQLFDGVSIRDCGLLIGPVISSDVLDNQPLGDADFQIMVSWYDEVNDYESAPSNPSNEARGVSGRPKLILHLGDIKVGMPDRITHFRIYRTMTNGNKFYYCGQVAATESTVILTATDADLGRPPRYSDDPMPALRQVVGGNGRFWAIGTVVYSEGVVASITEGSTVIQGYTTGANATGWNTAMVGKYFCVAGDRAHKYIIYDVDETLQTIRIRPPYRGSTATDATYEILSDQWRLYYCEKRPLGKAMPENWSGVNVLSVKYGDNAESGGVGFVSGMVVILTNDNCYAVEGNGPLEYKVIPAPGAVTGTCAWRTIKSNGRDALFFLSTHYFGIWRYAPHGQDPKMVNIGEKIMKKLRALDQTKMKYAHAEFVDGKYKIFLTSTDAVGNAVGDVCFVWDDVFARWTEDETIPATACGKFVIDGAESAVIGDEHGFVYRQSPGNYEGSNLLSGKITGTADSGSTSTLVDSDAGWTVNECKGIPVNIISGTGSGQRRIVASNTANTLVPAVAFTTAPDETSVYALGAVRFLRRFPWISPKDVVRYWKGKIHQAPQSSGNLTIKTYKDYGLTTEERLTTVSLTAGIASFGIESRADAFTFDFIQDDVAVDIEIYALMPELGVVKNQPIKQEKEDGQQRPRQRNR